MHFPDAFQNTTKRKPQKHGKERSQSNDAPLIIICNENKCSLLHLLPFFHFAAKVVYWWSKNSCSLNHLSTCGLEWWELHKLCGQVCESEGGNEIHTSLP